MSPIVFSITLGQLEALRRLPRPAPDNYAPTTDALIRKGLARIAPGVFPRTLEATESAKLLLAAMVGLAQFKPHP